MDAPAQSGHPRSMAQGQTGRILIVESDRARQTELERQLSAIGHVVETAPDGFAALEHLEHSMPDVVLLALDPERKGGFDFLQEARALLPAASFIAMAETGSTDTAVKALEFGADRLLTRSVRPDALALIVERSLDKPLLARDAMEARSGAAATLPTIALMDRVVGVHPSMQRLFNRLLQAAKSRSTVLIQGETGTGKELIAKAVHEHSLRSEGPLVRLNCAALAESVLESELFGHEKGAFTGAVTRRRGRFEQADGGTLFLDELSEMPLSVQIKLLRFLQERELERVGGNETVKVNVRVVAATNRDLKSLVEDGKFREDLYFRLKVVVLDVPPLRARPSDIPLLADHFLRLYAGENDKIVRGFTQEAKEALVGLPLARERSRASACDRASGSALRERPHRHRRFAHRGARAGGRALEPTGSRCDPRGGRALYDHANPRSSRRLTDQGRGDSRHQQTNHSLSSRGVGGRQERLQV